MAWGIVATVSEPDPLVLAFVASHLARGAAEARLFLDRPQPSLEARLAGVPGVVVTLCDDAWWAGVPGGRPWAPDRRQRHNLQRAYDEVGPEGGPEWLLHVDADELLAPGDVGARLAALPDGVDFALVPVAERVWLAEPDARNILDGAFRRPSGEARQAEVDRIDGPAAPYLRQGMTCYVGGKGFFRVGRGLAVDIHGPVGLAPERRAILDGPLILHFDGLTPQSWVRKKRRRLAQMPVWQTMESGARRAQMAAVARTSDDAELERLFLSLRRLDPARAAALDALGLIVRPRLDVAGEIARHLPGPAPDLSAAALDAQEMGWRAIPPLARAKAWARHAWRRLTAPARPARR